MATQRKSEKAALMRTGSEAAPEESEEESQQDELDQIMSEIEQLQKEIDTVEEKDVKPAASASSSPARKLQAVSSRPSSKDPEPEPEEEPTLTVSSTPDEDFLAEIREGAVANADDVGLEQTLATLKEESPAPGKSVFDLQPSPSQSRSLAPVEDPSSNDSTQEEFHEEEDHTEEELMSRHDSSEEHDPVESSEEGSLTMMLTGNMTLKLKYEKDGQAVVVSFTDSALKVQLVDGTEFKIPVRSRSARRAA